MSHGQATGATWKTYDGQNPWQTAGGDYDPSAIAMAISYDPQTGWITWGDVTPLVQQWVNAPAANFGFLIKSPSTNLIRFHARDWPPGPQLEVTYQ